MHHQEPLLLLLLVSSWIVEALLLLECVKVIHIIFEHIILYDKVVKAIDSLMRVLAHSEPLTHTGIEGVQVLSGSTSFSLSCFRDAEDFALA